MMDPIKGAFIGMIGVPLAAVLLALMWRHPWESLAAIGLIVAVIVVAAFGIHFEQMAPAKAMADEDDAAAAEAARLHALKAWRPHADIDAQWPATKPVAKYVRGPGGVGLKLNRD